MQSTDLAEKLLIAQKIFNEFDVSKVSGIMKILIQKRNALSKVTTNHELNIEILFNLHPLLEILPSIIEQACFL